MCVLLCRNDILGGMWFTVCEEAWEMGPIVLMKRSSVYHIVPSPASLQQGL